MVIKNQEFMKENTFSLTVHNTQKQYARSFRHTRVYAQQYNRKHPKAISREYHARRRVFIYIYICI